MNAESDAPRHDDPAPDKSQREVVTELIQLAWPIVGLNVLQVLALAVDTAMVGRVEGGESALAGMGYASQLAFLLMVAMIGLTVGTVAFVARAYGAGQPERVHHLLHQSTQLTVGLGLTIAVVGNLIALPLLTLLNAEGAALDAGLAYLRPLLLGVVFNYLNILYAAVLRGVGNTRMAFVVALVMNLINVALNYGLILGHYGLPALGVQGAAIGTVISQAVAVVLMVVLLRRGAVPGVRPEIALRPLDGPLVRDLVRIGWPAAVDLVVLNAAFLSIIGLLGSISQLAVAAHGVGLRVQALAFVPGLSISQACGALVGNALGGRNLGNAHKAVWASVGLNLVVMSALAAVLYGYAGPIVQIFDVPPESETYRYAVMWMGLLAGSMPLAAVTISFTGLLQGAGATRTSLRLNAWTTGAQIPASWLLGFPLGLGAWGVWFAFPASFAVKMIWAFIEYRRGHWAQTGARV